MANFIKKVSGQSSSASSCCGVESKEVEQKQEAQSDSCCGTSSNSSDSCCG